MGLLPKPYQAAYEEAISDWEKALQWAQTHHDNNTAEHAREKLARLRRRLEKQKPPPLEYGDCFWDRFAIPPEILDRLLRVLDSQSANGVGALNPNSSKIIDPKKNPRPGILTPTEVEQEIWKDRLKQTGAEQDDTSARLGEQVDRFLEHEKLRVHSENLSAGRFGSKRNNLHRFLDWAGRTTPVDAINGAVIQDFHAHLLKQIHANTLSSDTARDRLNDTIAFVRWMWQLEILKDLPRILIQKSKTLSISKKLSMPDVFTIEEVQQLLAKAEKRTKLFLLLMLNIGAYQSDISDLRQGEVNWEQGTIRRKRSKTKRHRDVPTVTYRLWPQTLELLKQFRSPSGERVLVNQNGNPLVDRGIKSNGQAYTNDAIKNAFDRLKKKTGITKTMKLLRKTSATLIRSQADYRGLEDLFLGHSPTSMSDRHYAQPPEQLLAEATDWLGKAYGVIK